MLKELEYPLSLLDTCGVHPFHKLNIVFLMVNIASIIFITVLLVLKFALDADLQTVELANVFLMMSLKYFVVIFKKGEIRALVKEIESFWKHQEKDESVSRIFNYLRFITTCWRMLYCFGMFFYTVKPIFLRGSSIFSCYIPKNIPFFVVYAVEIYFIFTGAGAYVGFNLFLITVITLSVAQFREINIKLEQLNIEGILDQEGLKKRVDTLKTCVKHHTFLIRVIENLNEILYIPVGMLIGVTTLLLCLHMYILSSSHVSTMEFIRIVFTSTAICFEFMFGYGIPAQMLMNEAEYVAYAIYCQCSWYLATTPVKRILLIMLMRSQMVVCITIKKLIIVNNQTFLMMLKTAYSFYTFLRTITIVSSEP